MKKHTLILALILCAALLTGAVPAFAAGNEARLYNVYGDHMLFQQNADAVFAGEAAPGTALSVTLKDNAGETVRTANGTAGADGTFSLSFAAPAGSYDPYTVTLTAGGATVKTLTDVVFGELWLSFGQSNMEYNLHGTAEGRAMQAAGETGSRNLRVLQIPHPVKNGAIYAEPTPQTDAVNCYWYTGDQADVYGMSAVGYFFAADLLETLDVPVGILNAAVGGSSIDAWIPRAAIDGDTDVKSAVISHGAYVTPANWENAGPYHICMTGLYNSKIAPLTNFRPSGAVWYQGETDLMLYNDPAYYAQLFDLMQDSYTDLFSHTNGRFPIMFTQLVSFDYGLGPFAETAFNEAFTTLAAGDPASRGEVVVHDLPLDYYPEWGAIHPMTKKPIAERMANCAKALVYGGDMPASAPAMTGTQVSDGSVLVSFSNVGDGLICTDDTLHGFAVYGADGFCVPAEAEIVSADTVRVFSDEVAAPAGATYAVNSISTSANLWSSYNGKAYQPAAAFGASDPAATKLFDDAEWMRCETLKAWQNADSDPGFRDVWTAKRAALTVSADAAEGDGSLAITGKSLLFSVSTAFAEAKNGKMNRHDNIDTDYTDYGTLSVRVKVTGSKDVTLEGLRLYKDKTLYYCPLCLESGKNAAVIPADGDWHTLTFDLNALGIYGSAADRWSNEALRGVTELRLCFSGAGAELQIDGFRFAPEDAGTEYPRAKLQRLIDAVLAFIEKIKAMFSNLFSGS
ncbi:MAG: hypothetical protein IJK02_04980 [Clostridia bacterium]|nr:hypothetical protein [Clostridia bacterium]